MVRVREEGRRWTLEHVLVTLQQSDAIAFMEVCRAIARVLEDAYVRLRDDDPRWAAPWDEVELMLNANGPMVHAGSDGDNGQTGRKLAMDFYGPRIPIGGGALSGKHLTHIDRIGGYAAREAALRAVRSGASECLVRLAWAPNRPEPLDCATTWPAEAGGKRPGSSITARSPSATTRVRSRERLREAGISTTYRCPGIVLASSTGRASPLAAMRGRPQSARLTTGNEQSTGAIGACPCFAYDSSST